MPIRAHELDIRFAVAGRAKNVDAAHPIWAKALPISVRHAPDDAGQTARITHGDYFQAIQTYLQRDGARHLQAVRAHTSPTPSPPVVPEKIDVILEKHGEFYHPARITVAEPEGSQSYVLNVAVTPAGIECMQNEIGSLRHAAPRLPEGSIPRVYGEGHAESPNGLRFGMFLADWFEDYHEFHLSADTRDGTRKIIVWDNQRGPYFLEADAGAEVYAEIAYLLTRAYDPATTRQIYPWHHASGDFVIRPHENGVDVKLITVRQYAPTLGSEDDRELDQESRLMAALVFFANLTLRIRIDRLDGTGEMAWAGDVAVAATVTGFKRGAGESLLPDLTPLLRSHDTNDWITLLKAVGARYRLMPAEEALLGRHIAAHAVCLHATIRREFHL